MSICARPQQRRRLSHHCLTRQEPTPSLSRASRLFSPTLLQPSPPPCHTCLFTLIEDACFIIASGDGKKQWGLGSVIKGAVPSLSAELAAANPLTSTFWWYAKHPVARLATAATVRSKSSTWNHVRRLLTIVVRGLARASALVESESWSMPPPPPLLLASF